MKNLHILLALAALLLGSSCKKHDPIAVPEPPEVVTKSAFLQDSTSFTVNGKHYTNALIDPAFSRSYGNRGVNLQLSTTNGEWGISAGINQYWVGSADSVQYSSESSTMLKNNEGGITVSFIKKYNKEKSLKFGSMYFPTTGDQFYTLGDYRYAIDFQRTGKDEGVAISLTVNKETLTSYSPLSINKESKLTAENQSKSKFKILKIEEIKGTSFVIIEATFEATLFDKNENPVKVTDGFFRITTPKTGEKPGSFTLLYL